jgi:hypothetical protein
VLGPEKWEDVILSTSTPQDDVNAQINDCMKDVLFLQRNATVAARESTEESTEEFINEAATEFLFTLNHQDVDPASLASRARIFRR